MIIDAPSGKSTLCGPTGSLSSSFHAEVVALEMCLEAVLQHQDLPGISEVRIYTDSQSALQMLKSGTAVATDPTAASCCRPTEHPRHPTMGS